MPDDSLQTRLREVRLLLTDVDGVLTDGRLHFDVDGNELKTFHVHDAAGIVYWQRAGGLTGFLSGRGSRVVEQRAAELGIAEVHLGHIDKKPVFDEILTRLELDASAVCYVGDDLLDLPLLERSGIGIAPRDARPEVRERADYVTDAVSGFGVVREAIELILRAKERWQEVVDKGGLP